MSLRELRLARWCRMGLTFAENTRPRCHNCWSPAFPAAWLFAVWFTGCNNTCFTFTSNPPTGTIGIKASDPSPSCTLTRANGAVRLTVQTVPMCSSCSESGRIQHIFVSIRGIEVHPSTTADDDSPDWQELLPPDLVKQPLQVDLVRGTADQSAREPLGDIVAIPAGIYRQVRLRFVPNQPATDDRLAEKNACGSRGFNCVVTADGRIQPLLLDGGSPKLSITSDRIVGGFLLIPPDADTHLVIEFKASWALASSAQEGVHLLPTLTGSAWAERQPTQRLDFNDLVTQGDSQNQQRNAASTAPGTSVTRTSWGAAGESRERTRRKFL
jgi:hypothetical protein